MRLYPSTQNGDASQEPPLEVHLLGVTDFDSCLALQRRLVFELGDRRDGRAQLLLCEHPPLITVGRRGSWAHIHCDPRELATRQLSVRWVNRGGGCVVHGPGQLAVYPMVPLDVRGWGLAEYRRRLQRCLVALADEFAVRADVAVDPTGVRGRIGQFAFLGSAIKDWISYHGFFLNVAPDMITQRLVAPYAATNGHVPRASSLAAERGRPVKMRAVREAVVRLLAEHLDYPHWHLYAGHPWLKATRRPYAVATHTG